ncbi:MAG: glycosyltransferase [Chthoniobacterales bacterium]
MLGYYAHDHGSGHAQFARLIASATKTVVLTASTAPLDEANAVTRLPSDLPDDHTLDLREFPAPAYAHYAPIGLKTLRARNRLILDSIERHDLSLLIVDVSVEVAALARLSGVPYAYVRLFGDRSDPPHQFAYAGATFLLAYYPERLESSETPDWIREKTLYLGFFSRFDRLTAGQTRQTPDRLITLIRGTGGAHNPPIDFLNLRRSFPDHRIVSIGSSTPTDSESSSLDVEHLGFLPDPLDLLSRADLVLAACGAGTVCELASLQKRFLAIAESRPFDEQARFADALASHGLCAVVTTTEPNLAELAADLRPDWSPHRRPDAPTLFAHWLARHSSDPRALLADVRRYRSIERLPTA